ncbi:hypothetical protein FA10DRAFT_297732 [Acaromyces ingoldii]|uniref:MaoC-like domain-containing protein n=1 Tax=Acaromyces ingoldii TaxID=215250 RepID=A0A316YB19_9BASI|nr:hypothetical protein FA10DRAFT_297732 [Acaromyces ingoldii]PWN86757.1 hypothetical protein FA10DRAFT_297732 [Acaromyces ingoldii]
MGGFGKISGRHLPACCFPILHGLCSFGISARLLQRQVGLFPHIKARFAGTVVPGKQLTVKAWKVDSKTILFESCVDERVVLHAAAVTLA